MVRPDCRATPINGYNAAPISLAAPRPLAEPLVIENLRNIAIIAHVDHGKTTLVDQLLRQSGTLQERTGGGERLMDSNDLEKERGITILAKNTAIRWHDYHINIVDTPGHADFGGEVERVLSMVDSVLLLVDAVDGPMPQTRFVTQKAFALGLKPIVVINKVDRPGARPEWVLDQTFDLFDRLGATEEQLDFPVIYASALRGYAGMSPDVTEGTMEPLFQLIVDRVSPPNVDPEGPFQMQISSLDYNSYVGLIGIGRIQRGRVKTNTPVTVIDPQGQRRPGRVLQILGFLGLERVEFPEASAGDIIAFTGMEQLNISDTLCDPAQVEASAAVDGGRAHGEHELRRQHLALRRPRGQVRHLAPVARAAAARTQAQRGAARGGHRGSRQIQGLRPRRTAPVHPDREHAPRRL